MLSWQQRIDKARQRTGILFRGPRGFTGEDRALSLDWMTCSCGQLDARIPRHLDPNKHNSGAPKDMELLVLGQKFHYAVVDNEFDRAEVLYRKIQARAELLIEEIERAGDTETTEEQTEDDRKEPTEQGRATTP